jgi:hypothetical protein
MPLAQNARLLRLWRGAVICGPVRYSYRQVGYLPVDREGAKTDRASFDPGGTILLALTLAAYALAMTIGHGHFGPLNIALLLAAVFGVVLFLGVEAKTPSPLVMQKTPKTLANKGFSLRQQF